MTLTTFITTTILIATIKTMLFDDAVLLLDGGGGGTCLWNECWEPPALVVRLVPFDPCWDWMMRHHHHYD